MANVHNATRLSNHRIRVLACILAYQTGKPYDVASRCIALADYKHPTETKGSKYRIAKDLINARNK